MEMKKNVANVALGVSPDVKAASRRPGQNNLAAAWRGEGRQLQSFVPAGQDARLNVRRDACRYTYKLRFDTWPTRGRLRATQ